MASEHKVEEAMRDLLALWDRLRSVPSSRGVRGKIIRNHAAQLATSHVQARRMLEQRLADAEVCLNHESLSTIILCTIDWIDLNFALGDESATEAWFHSGAGQQCIVYVAMMGAVLEWLGDGDGSLRRCFERKLRERG